MRTMRRAGPFGPAICGWGSTGNRIASSTTVDVLAKRLKSLKERRGALDVE